MRQVTLEVGRVYKCEDRFVKIIYYDAGTCDSGGEFFGISCNKSGLLNIEFAYTYSFSERGRSSPRNPCKTGHPLEKIADEPEEFKVGQIYMCGNTKVRILHHEDSEKTTGSLGTFVAVPVDEDGEFNTDGLVGLFDDDDGCAGADNPGRLQYGLEKVVLVKRLC